jgi:hypothetical protein
MIRVFGEGGITDRGHGLVGSNGASRWVHTRDEGLTTTPSVRSYGFLHYDAPVNRPRRSGAGLISVARFGEIAI